MGGGIRFPVAQWRQAYQMPSSVDEEKPRAVVTLLGPSPNQANRGVTHTFKPQFGPVISEISIKTEPSLFHLVCI